MFLVGQQVLRFEVVKDAEEGFGAASEHGTLLFGTPAAPRYARLSQRTVEGVARDVFHLRKVETVLGREIGDIVFTEDPFLSRRHAAVWCKEYVQPKGQPRRFSLDGPGLVERHLPSDPRGDPLEERRSLPHRPAALPVRPRRAGGCMTHGEPPVTQPETPSLEPRRRGG